ncbi:MAG: hypothetical protein ABI967_08255 [bacterium]
MMMIQKASRLVNFFGVRGPGDRLFRYTSIKAAIANITQNQKALQRTHQLVTHQQLLPTRIVHNNTVH